MRILVVDDHEVVRRGICSVLATESSLTLCGEAVDGKDAVAKAKVLRPDIIVMDITMPQMNGLDATREMPLLDEVGLDSALRWYIDGFCDRSKVSVETKLASGFSEDLPRDMALSVFRIVQESLTNIHRHSGSPTALVQIDRSPSEITLVVEDEGKGLPAQVQSKISSGELTGVGLRGMRERVR
jgi:two-component system, NarL family, sensor kinase